MLQRGHLCFCHVRWNAPIRRIPYWLITPIVISILISQEADWLCMESQYPATKVTRPPARAPQSLAAVFLRTWTMAPKAIPSAVLFHRAADWRD